MADELSTIPHIKQPLRLPEQVAQFLSAEIKKGTFQPGKKLPPENVLAEKFGVSRTVIREALARLKYDGLLESRQGSGAIVVGAVSTTVFRLNQVEEDNYIDLGYLYELRAILEGTAASIAALRRTEDELRELEQCIKEMSDAVKEGIDGTDPDTRFHQLISTATHNPYLQDLMLVLTEKLRGIIKRARTHSSKNPRLPGLVQEEHEAIFVAIKAKDPEGARKAVVRHLRSAAKRLGASISELV